MDWTLVRSRDHHPPASLRAAAVAAAALSPWLARQGKPFRDAVLCQAAVRRFARGDKISGLGESGSDLYFLFEGGVQAAIARADLEVTATHVVSPHRWFGVHGAISDGPTIEEYRASAASVVVVVPRSVLGSKTRTNECHASAATDLLLEALKASVESGGGLAGLKSEHRVRSKLHSLAAATSVADERSCELRMSQEDLASVSCVSRSVVCKVISQLADEGIVKAGYRRISVLDRRRLIG